MGFDKEILVVQMKELFKQLVDNCALNIPEYSTSAYGWAKFLCGHPDRCDIPDKTRPTVFMYGIESADSFDTICSHTATVNAVFGVQAYCNVLQVEGRFDRLWASIKRRFDFNAMSYDLPQSYLITQFDESKINFSNARLGDFGIESIGFLGRDSIKQNNGEIIRYQQLLEIKLRFANALPSVARNPVITIS